MATPISSRLAIALGLLAGGLSLPTLAATPLSGADIEALIGGNTVQGSMLETGAYSEFYGADGLIRGEGYGGTWFIKDDTMCFKYGDEDPTCYGVAQEGEELQWLLEGSVDGTGSIIPGNPNDY